MDSRPALFFLFLALAYSSEDKKKTLANDHYFFDFQSIIDDLFFIWFDLDDGFSIDAEVIEKGADKEAENKNGETSLHLAAMNNSAEVAQFLIERGADKEAANKNGETSLHLVAMKNNAEVAQFLIERGAKIVKIGEPQFTSETSMMSGMMCVFLTDAEYLRLFSTCKYLYQRVNPNEKKYETRMKKICAQNPSLQDFKIVHYEGFSKVDKDGNVVYKGYGFGNAINPLFANKTRMLRRAYGEDFYVIACKREEKYEGGFFNGLFHGHGKYETKGVTYRGEFQHGAPTGKGKLEYKYDWQSCTQFYPHSFGKSFILGVKGEGNAHDWINVEEKTLIFDHTFPLLNVVYEGEVKNGLPNGKGIYYEGATGAFHYGHFKDGIPNGRGLWKERDRLIGAKIKKGTFEEKRILKSGEILY